MASGVCRLSWRLWRQPMLLSRLLSTTPRLSSGISFGRDTLAMSLTSPKRDGFHAPAEWEPHAACLVGWPWRGDVWPYGGREAHTAILEVVRALCASRSERVIVVAKPGTFTDSHSKELAREIASGQVEVCPVVCDDAWMRDTGPTFVISSDRREIRGVNWTFNGWGKVRSPESRAHDEVDAAVAKAVCDVKGFRVYDTDLICEGGAIAFDGEGTVITTDSVLMDDNRNGVNKTVGEVKEILLSHLGAEKVLWLPQGIYWDKSVKGHVDNLVVFVGPAEVVLNWTDDETDPQFDISRTAEGILACATDAKGRKFTIHRLPQPDPVFETEEEITALYPPVQIGAVRRLPASYVNFYIANKAVMVPQFNQPKKDSEAVEKLRSLFPDREVIGVHTRAILVGGGNIHCITQQVPAVIDIIPPK